MLHQLSRAQLWRKLYYKSRWYQLYAATGGGLCVYSRPCNYIGRITALQWVVLYCTLYCTRTVYCTVYNVHGAINVKFCGMVFFWITIIQNPKAGYNSVMDPHRTKKKLSKLKKNLNPKAKSRTLQKLTKSMYSSIFYDFQKYFDKNSCYDDGYTSW